MIIDATFGENSASFNSSVKESSVTFSAQFNGGIGAGQNGATFIPSVSEDGTLSWTNDKGLPNPAPVNIKGVDGKDGANGKDGKDGYTPKKGVDYFDGKDGKDGTDGTNGTDGKDGVDGRTPIKGIDYFTDADKNEMVQAVITALPKYNGEVVEV